MYKGILVTTFVLVFGTSVFAQAPQSLHSGVFISDIWEHKVLMKGPHDFTESQEGANNLWEWADWACGLYGRSAIGPLNQTPPDNQCIMWLGEYSRKPAVFREHVDSGVISEHYHCSVQYLFACATNR